MSDKELRDVERFARQKGKEAAQPLPPKNRTMIERNYEALQEELAAERAKVRELVEALEWYVMEDDVIEGMEGNEFWVEGKRKAQALIEKCKEEPNNE